MATLANVLVGTLLTLLLGLAIGIQTARHDRLRQVLRPVLDAAQTLPAFVWKSLRGGLLAVVRK